MKAFCEKVKEKARSDEYLRLLEYFQEYNNRRITQLDLIEMVKDLLGEYPGFFDEFLNVFEFSNACLTRSMEPAKNSNKRKKRKKPGFEKIGEINGYSKKIRLASNSVQKPNTQSTPRNKTDGHLVQALEFCEKVMKQTSSEEYLALLKYLHDYGIGKITMVRLKIMIAKYFPNFMDEFLYILEFNENLTQPSAESQGDIDNKQEKPNKNRNIRQLNDELTPSYEFLPKQLSGVHSSGIDELGKEVLNSCCRISKRSYNEVPSAHRGPVWLSDPHQNMLKEKEDELFERDMLKGWMHSTKKNATDLYEDIKKGKIQKPTMEDVKDKFTSYNLRFIEKMYQKSGPLVLNQLLHSPEAVLPVLISRLNKMESPSPGT